jgi:4-hydroxy-tetrahydrodipicolinate synthase
MVPSTDLRGVYSAIATPLDEYLDFDKEAFVRHSKFLLRNGCDGISLLGTTGEATSFSVAERMDILSAAIDGGLPANRLLPGTGASAISDAVALTRHASNLGVAGVLLLPPFYYKNIEDEGLFGFYREVIERVNSDKLKIVLYQIPQMSGLRLSLELIGRLVNEFPGNIVGLKDSSGDLLGMTAIVREFPTLSVMAGPDTQLLPLLEAGGAGCITATSNLGPQDLAFIYDHFSDRSQVNELAAAQARLALNRAASTARYPQIPAVKAMLSVITGHDDWRRVRVPLTALTPQQTSLLAADFVVTQISNDELESEGTLP